MKSSSPRKKSRVFTIPELMAFCESLTGNRKEDHLLGKAAGISNNQTDLLRALVGKVEYNVKDIDEDTRNSVISDYQAGVPIHDITLKYNLHWDSYVHNIVKQEGVEACRKDKWSYIKTSLLINLKEVKKYKWKDISMKLEKSPDACISKYKDLCTPKWNDSRVRKLVHLRDDEDMSWEKIGYALVKHPRLCKDKYNEVKGGADAV